MTNKLIPRIKNGVESNTHFLYTDSKGREWSVVNFELFMRDIIERMGHGAERFLDYNWEGMYFGNDNDSLESNQFRGMDSEEVIKQIEKSYEMPKV